MRAIGGWRAYAREAQACAELVWARGDAERDTIERRIAQLLKGKLGSSR